MGPHSLHWASHSLIWALPCWNWAIPSLFWALASPLGGPPPHSGASLLELGDPFSLLGACFSIGRPTTSFGRFPAGIGRSLLSFGRLLLNRTPHSLHWASPSRTAVPPRPITIPEKKRSIHRSMRECFSSHYPNCRVKFAISIAEAADSQPLLPAFVPALSTACSMLSVVNTPKMVGTPV